MFTWREPRFKPYGCFRRLSGQTLRDAMYSWFPGIPWIACAEFVHYHEHFRCSP
jgi:hypothetical protein